MTIGKGLVGRTLGALFALAVVTCIYYPSAWARNPDPVPSPQTEQIGEINRIMGTVSIMRAGEGPPQAARENAPIFLQDILSTDQSGKVWWRSGPKGAAVQQGDASLGNSSALEFVRFDQDGMSVGFSGEVGHGMIRFTKDLPKSVPPSHFTISTPTAVIEVMPSDRPTDFVVEVREDQKLTTVYVIWGAVMVRHISPQFVQERIVRSCQRVDVEEAKEPSPVIGVSPETLKELIRKTTIPNTLPEDVPSCRDETFVEPWVIDQRPPGVVGCPCPHGLEFVGGVCAECPRWKTYHRTTCSCVSRCRYDNQCRRCETCFNGLCVPKPCPSGQWLDPKTCTCMRRCPPIPCPQGFRFNPRTCRCEQTPCEKKCPPGQYLNPETCECSRLQPDCRRKCPPGQRLDLETCRCVPKCLIKCLPGEWLNLEKCECEPRCRKQCPSGQHLDLTACKCVGDVIAPKKGCNSDGECGPGSFCRNRKCVPKEGHLDKPVPHKPEHDMLPTEPRRKPEHNMLPTEPRRKPEHNMLPTEPRHKPERPVLPVEPRHKPEHPVLPVQPQQKKDLQQ